MPSEDPDKDRVATALREFRGADSQRDIVVICDDKRNIRMVIRGCLEEAFSEAGLTGVLDFATAEEALASVRNRIGKVGLIITDLNMGQMSGLTFAAKVRHELGDQGIPIVLMSGNVRKGNGKSGLGEVVDGLMDRGVVDAVIEKPFENIAALCDAVIAAVKRREEILKSSADA